MSNWFNRDDYMRMEKLKGHEFKNFEEDFEDLKKALGVEQTKKKWTFLDDGDDWGRLQEGVASSPEIIDQHLVVSSIRTRPYGDQVVYISKTLQEANDLATSYWKDLVRAGKTDRSICVVFGNVENPEDWTMTESMFDSSREDDKWAEINGEPDQTIKFDEGKPRPSLVPQGIINGMAKVREYGLGKYGDKESWRMVEVDRYVNALYRHVMAVADGEWLDSESGLPHVDHIAVNAAFIRELREEEQK